MFYPLTTALAVIVEGNTDVVTGAVGRDSSPVYMRAVTYEGCLGGESPQF